MKRYSYAAGACSFVVMLLFSGIVFGAPTATETKAPAKAKTKEEAAMPPSISGKVVETMNSGGYTYVCLEKDGEKTWVAVPETKVTVGQEMAFDAGSPMANFKSKTLNRTFERIYFSSGPVSSGEAGHAAAPAVKKTAPVSVTNVKVEKATGPDAYTVAEIFAKRTKLNKKNAVVHATVVKVALGIMGTNWLHLQDGTGDIKKNTHDLVATTQDKAEIGDVVTVRGTVSKDKDFGSGYKYNVILEKASIQR